ncbi:hypothetical protein FA95DRAFT_1494990 [Auriscalpium vulgare]|uniref:Uncharacterized protein n=1 Tax=Auriscalpium vulgare TaxID=40419 RepID=A0ACB8RPR9_9AGAM|nr:hypothetical protein FA95DRAFT_1494990 [Auriscalpium vulgare]
MQTIRRRWHSTRTVNELPDKIRALLRETAQPVAVVTSFMPPPAPDAEFVPGPRCHGATLSSFTSIALAPHPLVAFSLRVPSRMAKTLSTLASPSSTLPSSSPSSSSPFPSFPALTSTDAHMIINILSAAQARAALIFSQPDAHPRPFEDHAMPWHLSREGLPVLAGSIGALACRVVGAAWPLSDLDALARGTGDEDEGGAPPPWVVDGVASELFIARVVRVEEPKRLELAGDTQDIPLLYHRRDYTTVAGAGRRKAV